MRITYLFDPLCGWSYGAGPALERLATLEDVAVSLAPTGLFEGDGSRPMDRHFAQFAWQNDERIARLTGQTFSEAYRENVLGAVGRRFDSTAATHGLVAVGLTQPDQELAALKALQAARYVDGVDTGDAAAVATILDKAGFVEAAQRVRTPDQPLLTACQTRISAARGDMARFGAQGVPTLLVENDQTRRMVGGSVLYGDFDLLTAALRAA